MMDISTKCLVDTREMEEPKLDTSIFKLSEQHLGFTKDSQALNQAYNRAPRETYETYQDRLSIKQKGR